jgi:hypothetical protein
MPWTDILEKLVSGSQEALMGEGEPSTLDLVRAKEGPRENRGFGNIIHNLGLIGANSRVTADAQRNAEEERQINNDYKRSMTESNRSLIPYRQGLLDVKKAYNEVQKYKADIANTTTLQGLEVRRGELKAKMDQAAAALQNAETNAKREINEDNKLAWEQKAQEARMTLDWYRSIHDVDLREQANKISQQNANTAADVGRSTVTRNNASAELMGTEGTLNTTKDQILNADPAQFGRAADAITSGTKAGIVDAEPGMLESILQGAGIKDPSTTGSDIMEQWGNPGINPADVSTSSSITPQKSPQKPQVKPKTQGSASGSPPVSKLLEGVPKAFKNPATGKVEKWMLLRGNPVKVG